MLSSVEINKIFNDRVKIVVYKDIHRYKSLESLLSPYGYVIVLYPWSNIDNNTGHWIGIIKTIQGIEFFDSYGKMPDEYIKWFNSKNPEILRMMRKYKRKGGRIHFNQYKLQGHTTKDESCGYWVIMRILLRNYTTDEFAHLFIGLNNPSEILVEFFRICLDV